MEYLYPDKSIEELLPEWFSSGVGLIILTQGVKCGNLLEKRRLTQGGHNG